MSTEPAAAQFLASVVQSGTKAASVRSHIGPVERAFQLAKSSDHQSVAEIFRALDIEGRRTVAISGPMLLRQLRAMIREATAVAQVGCGRSI